MEEVRQLVQEEGREARNLVAFHVAVDTPARISRKPPRSIPQQTRRAPPRPPDSRLRSASAGRDKRSELRARYWALLFGDLQRAVGEIYNTVEAHENLSECQEVILVLENYTRDFKALCEWFRLKWEYDHTPPPQRPQSLAWEIRKTDFVRPESRRAHSVKSSPSVSGKNSPLLSGHNTPSGKNSPNLTGKTSPGSGKLSPRVSSVTSPKGNVEFFSNKLTSKVATKPEPKLAKDLGKQLSDIKERVGDDRNDGGDGDKAKGKPNKETKMQKVIKHSIDLSDQAKATIAKLNVMECAFLEKQLIENAIKNENMLNKDRDREIEEKSGKEVNGSPKVSPVKSEDNFADVSNESSSKSLEEGDLNKDTKTVDKDKTLNDNKATKIETKALVSGTVTKKDEVKVKDDTKKADESKDETKKDEFKTPNPKIEVKPRPAYSQAAAKPKVESATKIEAKTSQRSVALTRSKTVIEIRPNSAAKAQRNFPKRNQTSKCSYPFNLTTGRTSLFDSTPSKIKKPLNKVGSIDTKSKMESKKLIKRPSSLNVSQKDIDKHLEVKDSEDYSSTETVVTQIDMSRIDSSESLKTLIAEDAQLASDVAYTLEVLNIDKNENEGWLTVKSRRLSRESKKQPKSHWSNRFNQPSATTSLPTLNMIESPKQENKPIAPKTEDRAKSEQPVTPKVVKVNANPKPNKNKLNNNTSMIRQKSDVTGLKTKSARSKAVNKKSSKDKDRRNDSASELTKNRLHSSLESLTGLSRSQESTEEAFDFDKWKAEFISTFKYLDDDDQISDHNEILKSADPSEMSEIAEMTSQIEENERKISLALDFQSEVDQRKLSEEEELLNRQIMELQQVSDADLDTETDDTETDAELISEGPRLPSPPASLDLSSSLEDQYEAALEGMSWAERMDTLVALEALVARDPGRAQQLHAKLSQGIKRRGSFQDALRRLQAKQARAEQHRQELQTERTKKIHMLLTRVEEVKTAKNQLIDEKRNRMERRLQKAAENRDQHLKDIVRKAHDEEEKLREIAFIKQLEAENRRHEFLDQCRSHTTRLRLLRRDRLDKLEQKAAREAAVGARRAALEAARALHVQSLLERRALRDARTARRQEERRRARGTAAREKAEGVKSRLSALAAAAELEVDALRSRIKDKQDASEQRLAEHLQAIRSKATGPRLLTTSESQEQVTKEEETEIDNITLEKRERDRQKALRKKARKLRQKLLIAGQEFEEISGQELPQMSNNKISKILHQINNILTSVQIHEKSDNNNKKKEISNGIDSDKQVNGVEKKKSKKKKASSEEKQIIDTNESTENNENNTSDNKKTKKKKNKNENEIENDKKPDNANDKPKLSKTPSVASSMSDMSKISGKSDKKMTNIDWSYFEKVMNELNRAMDKNDKNSQDTLLHGMKIIGQLLGLAVDKEDNGMQVTNKCLSTAVHIINRIVTNSASAAALCLNTNCGLHIARLLAGQLERDQESDKAEQVLTKHCADCLTAAFESVSCTTKMYEEYGAEGNLTKEKGLLAAVRRRVHCLVSYLSLSGCMSHNDYPDTVGESMHALLSVAAALCQPCDIDTGQDRVTAVTNLRSNLSAGLCGARSELTSLYEKNENCADASKVARVARLLRSLAELDHGIVQEAFGEGRYPLEFKAAVAQLLSEHAPSDRELDVKNSGGNNSASQSEAIALDLIVLIGMVVVNNTQHRDTLCDNWSVLRTLCNLPANWIVSTHCHVLLPTLAALAQHPPAAAVIASELSKKMIEEYIDSPEAQNVKLVQLLKEGRKMENN